MHRFARHVSLALCLAVCPASAHAAGLGVRGGFSLDPDHAVVGGHLDLRSPIPGTRLVLPVVELGLGNDVTRITAAGDLTAKLPAFGAWGSYLGGELALQRTQVHDGLNHTDLGVLFVAGVDRVLDQAGAKVGFELKVGIVESPDFEVLFLYGFGR